MFSASFTFGLLPSALFSPFTFFRLLNPAVWVSRRARFPKLGVPCAAAARVAASNGADMCS